MKKVMCWVMAALLVLALSNQGTIAEALPSPDAASMVSLEGGMTLSGAPLELHIAECLRVDIVSAGPDGVWGDLTLPYVPPSIWGVALFDGWHLIYGEWTQTGDAALRIRFRAEDAAKLDGTVGLYLLIVAEK